MSDFLATLVLSRSLKFSYEYLALVAVFLTNFRQGCFRLTVGLQS
jgi:hypothetical protein